MTYYRLPDHLSFCEVDGRTIFLDLQRDRYLQLDPRTRSLLQQYGKGDALDAGPGVDRLRELGLIVPSEWPATLAPTTTTVPLRSLLDEPLLLLKPAWPLLPELLETIRRIRRVLKRRGLEVAVNEVRSRKAIYFGPAPSVAELAATVSRFRAARRLIPVQTNCLLDSLCLSAFLSRRRLRAELVFGVKLDPFAAHCWLQTADAIVNDGSDTVAAFTPVLAV